MRIKRHDLSKFSDLGTVVLYPTRTFHPEVLGESVYEKMLEKSKSTTYYYSTDLNSEYLDFAKYCFDFNLPESDYWSSLKLNLYNFEDTVSKFTSRFDEISSNLVPQISDKVSDREEKHFFGKIEKSSSTIYLIKIPREIRTPLGKLSTVWKVEVYNKRLTTNNSIGDYFIDSDVLPGEFLTETPILSIYFGPDFDTQIEDHTLGECFGIVDYISRYNSLDLDLRCCLDDNIYGSFPKYINKYDYLKSVLEEIYSDRLLYIVNTTESGIISVDMFSAAYSDSKNKYRNQNTKLLRNDEPKSYSFINSDSGIILDRRSNTFLGFEDTISSHPLFKERYDSIPDKTYSRSSGGDEVIVSGKTYVHDNIQDIIGDSPEISPYWISKEDLKTSMFNHYYVMKSSGGNITPSGFVSLRSDKFLKVNVTPDKGYKFSQITGLDKTDYTLSNNTITFKTLSDGIKFTVEFSEKKYAVNINLSCDADYPEYGISNTYRMNEFSNIGLQLWYINSETGEEVLYSGETIYITDNTPLKFRVETKGSLYFIPDSSKFCFRDDPSTYLGLEGKYISLSVDAAKENILGGSSLYVVGSLQSIQYKVNIETSSEIQMSTKKKSILEYGDGFLCKFYNDLGKDINILVMNEDTGKIEEPGIYSITKEDDFTVLTFPKRTKQNPSLGIKNNYRILAGI